MPLAVESAISGAKEGTTHFRIRRLQVETGYWKTIFVESADGPSDVFDIAHWRPDLLVIANMPPGTYRFTWLRKTDKGTFRPLGNSAPVRLREVDSAQPAGTVADAGGVVTPPANGHRDGTGDGAPPGVASGRISAGLAVETIERPATAGSTAGGVAAPSAISLPAHELADVRPRGLEPGRLEVGETLGFLRGLGWIVEQVTGPIVRGVQEDTAQRMQRDREWFAAQMERERLQHVAALERDRQFMAAIQASYAKPDVSALEALRTELRQGLEDLRNELDDGPEGADDSGNPGSGSGDAVQSAIGKAQDNPWTFAGQAVEHLPEVIRAVAEVATGGKAQAAAVAAAESSGD